MRNAEEHNVNQPGEERNIHGHSEVEHEVLDVDVEEPVVKAQVEVA